jgi:hypothetical protein
METLRFPFGSVIRIALPLTCFLIVGCDHQQKGPGPTVTAVCTGNPHTDCGDKDINVTPTGVDKPEVCVCKGDKVEWHENGHPDFRVTFKRDSPFEDDDKVFYHTHGRSKGSKEWNSGTYFDYRIDVGTISVDPRIVGGGGH